MSQHLGPGAVARLDACPPGMWTVASSILTSGKTFFRWDWSWKHFYDHSLPSADSRRAVVSYWRKNGHWVLVNCLGGLPRNSVARLTDRAQNDLKWGSMWNLTDWASGFRAEDVWRVWMMMDNGGLPISYAHQWLSLRLRWAKSIIKEKNLIGACCYQNIIKTKKPFP